MRLLLIAALLCSACSETALPIASDPSIATSVTLVPATQTALPGTATPTAPPTPTLAAPASPTAAVVLSPLPTPPPTAVRTKTPSPIPFATFGNGQWVVGVDIAPGTYRTRSAPAGAFCHWNRLSGVGPRDILAAENPVGPAIVTIKPTDKFFFSEYCPPWTSDLSSLHPPLNTFGSGTLIVGVDVAPGTWRTGCGRGCDCVWQRLSGFGSGDGFVGSDRGDIIVLGGAQTYETIVTIQPTDRGFASSFCGFWAKIG